MRVDIVTIFPEAFAPLSLSILGRAQAAGIVAIKIHNLRDFTTDRHRAVDDYPYGGGAGMVMKPEPFFAAVAAILHEAGETKPRIILTTPQGRLLTQEVARELAKCNHLILLCGHYEGVDERVARGLATDEISIGDYILSGGELAAMVIVDAVVRLIPGVVGEEASVAQDSFSEGLLDYPHYTRPPEFQGMKVPAVLLSGHHEAIRRWRRKEALRRTLLRRPDLLERAILSKEDQKLLEEIRRELASSAI